MSFRTSTPELVWMAHDVIRVKVQMKKLPEKFPDGYEGFKEIGLS